MRSGGNSWAGAGLLGLALSNVATPSFAQDEGGLEANISFAQGLTFSGEDDSYGQTDLGFSVTSATRSQTFAFDLSTSVTQRLEDGFQADIVDPTVGLSYSIENRQTLFETNFRFRQSDADALIETTFGMLDILVLDEGTRDRRTGDVSLTFGREAPFGGTVMMGYDDTQFEGTTSTELIDSTTLTADVDLRFEIDRRITGTVGYGISETDRDGGQDVTTQRLSVGAELAITQTLNANLSFGKSRITTDSGSGESTETGLSYSFALTQERPNGDISFDLGSDITEAGRRTTATVGRTFETRGGSFYAEVGVSESDTSDLRPLAGLRYTEDLARGSISINLNQNFSTTTDGLDALNSRFRLDWQQDLNRTSQFGTDLTYQTTDVFGSDDESARLDLGLRFTQDLTEDWALTTRFVHSRFEANGEDDRQENDLFIGLETTLGWKP